MLSPGATLQGTSAEQISKTINAARSMVIVISNHTTKYLTNPKYYCYTGYNYTPLQPTIEPKMREACSFSKHADSNSGSVGVMTYNICELQAHKGFKKLAIMFSVPNDYNKYENWFAVGLYDIGKDCDDGLYQEMYYSDNQDFKRAKAKDCFLKHISEGYQVNATMSNASQSIIQLELWEGSGSHN
ncbi:bryoporin-like [Polypterus senegalus]|uniref:bryoporin-like n=1 Tax=Polypterus senegalus TaxID=55291 RepID=UPI001964F5A7|nr:bryoporin-like [Polypterus senegalus]XP_039620502.1 bryoporin-like [Polypterus senegalus]